ncbi:DUF6491 family protein [Sphingobium aquiterrae]|uniref:DUF6491 family protein n=1 Tax=Sphingobium aquiterrae TaxID=2038656 RepID=UPI00301711AE
MKKALIIALAMGAGVLAGNPAVAASGSTPPLIGHEPRIGQETSIPFVNHGGIRNWQVVDDDMVLVEGTGHKWYKVELFGPCNGLRFTNIALGFETRGVDSFDRFSAIRTRDGRCAVKSVTVAAPPAKKARKG